MSLSGLRQPHLYRTSKFYGPSVTTLSPLVQPWISLYIAEIKASVFTGDSDDFYLFYTGSDTGRNMSSSLWTQV